MALPFGSGFSPLMGEPRMGLTPIPQTTVFTTTLTTSGGAETITAADVLGGLLVINCDDAQTLTLPTAALMNAAIPATAVGATVFFDILNVGDTTITVAVGTGGTLVVGNSKSTVATIATVTSKRFALRITGVATEGVQGSSDSYVLYGFGQISAAVA